MEKTEAEEAEEEEMMVRWQTRLYVWWYPKKHFLLRVFFTPFKIRRRMRTLVPATKRIFDFFEWKWHEDNHIPEKSELRETYMDLYWESRLGHCQLSSGRIGWWCVNGELRPYIGKYFKQMIRRDNATESS